MTTADPDELLEPGSLQSEILSHIPELRRIAQIDIEIPFNLDSSNLGTGEWDTLSKLLYERMDSYDGFVIIHGTDTMVYTAAALSFSLLNLRKPVIITGAQRPLSKLRSDARSNLIDSIELATYDIPEVLIVFGQHILRGNRAKKISITRYDAFDTPNFPHLGEIGLSITLNQSMILKSQGASLLLPGFLPHVAVFGVYPSFDPQNFISLINSEIKSFILLGFGAGNLPGKDPDWIPFIRQTVDAGKTVFIGSHSAHGSTNLKLYKCGRLALEAGADMLGSMTHEAAYVKLQKILALTVKREKVREKFRQNWAGEQ